MDFSCLIYGVLMSKPQNVKSDGINVLNVMLRNTNDPRCESQVNQ